MDPIKAAQDAMLKELEAFRKANDERIAQIEKAGRADPLLEEKVNKANAAVADLQAQVRELEAAKARPAGAQEEDEEAAIRKAFNNVLRKGDPGPDAVKLVSVGTSGDGGYAVPTPIDQAIGEVALNNSPMRGLVGKVTVSNYNYKKLISQSDAASGWSAETGTRSATGTPTLAQIAPSFGELYAVATATNHSLQDVMFDVEGWLTREIGKKFGTTEDNAIWVGNGTDKPKGLTTYTFAASPTFGQIKSLLSGSAGAIGTTSADWVFDMILGLKPAYRQGASFVMAAATLATIRKMKGSGSGEYLWQPGINGASGTLAGYPVIEDENVPAIGAANYPVWFGNWSEAYLLADLPGATLIRDPYTTKGNTAFYVAKRLGGCLADSNAVIALKSNNS